VKDPDVAEAMQVTVEVADVVEPLSVTVVGFRVHVSPEVGDTVPVKLRVPEKPSRPVTVTVDDPPLPEKTGTPVGFAAIVKSCTMYVTVAV
jgi:hypothetical protein